MGLVSQERIQEPLCLKNLEHTHTLEAVGVIKKIWLAR